MQSRDPLSYTLKELVSHPSAQVRQEARQLIGSLLLLAREEKEITLGAPLPRADQQTALS